MRECVKAVKSLCIRSGELVGLRTQSTGVHNYLTSQGIVIPNFRTPLAQTGVVFAQSRSTYFTLLYVFLYSLFTPPINKTKIIIY